MREQRRSCTARLASAGQTLPALCPGLTSSASGGPALCGMMTLNVVLSPAPPQQPSAHGPALMLEAWQSEGPPTTLLIFPGSCGNTGEESCLQCNLTFRPVYKRAACWFYTYLRMGLDLLLAGVALVELLILLTPLPVQLAELVSADCWNTSMVALAMFSNKEFISWR